MMKRTVYISLMLFLLNTAQATAVELITIATGEQPPHSSRHSSSNGFINHIVQAAFNTQDIEVKFVFMPWPRTYKETAEGDFVATSFWYRDAKHQDKFYGSVTILHDRVVFFRKKSALPFIGLDDAKRHKLRLGLTRGYTYNQEIWAWQRQFPSLVSVVNSDLQNFKMLFLGRIDIFPSDEISGWYTLNKHFGSEQVQTIETVGQDLLEQQATILFSKAHPDAQRLLQVFNEGIQQLKQNGTFEQLQLDFITGKYAENRLTP